MHQQNIEKQLRIVGGYKAKYRVILLSLQYLKLTTTNLSDFLTMSCSNIYYFLIYLMHILLSYSIPFLRKSPQKMKNPVRLWVWVTKVGKTMSTKLLFFCSNQSASYRRMCVRYIIKKYIALCWDLFCPRTLSYWPCKLGQYDSVFRQNKSSTRHYDALKYYLWLAVISDEN
jgi:hypothetical protein